MNTTQMTTVLSYVLNALPAALRAPLRVETDGIIADMWAPPPSSRWEADRGTCPGEPTYFLDLGPDDALESARIAIVPEEVAGVDGEVFDLYYGLSVSDGGVCLGRYGLLSQCAAAAEWIADRLPAFMRQPLRHPDELEEGFHAAHAG